MYTDPSSVLIRFGSTRVSDVESTVLSPCLVHVNFGRGLPDALHTRVTALFSTTS